MESLTNGRIAALLEDLHRQADAADGPFKAQIMADLAASGKSVEEYFADLAAREKAGGQSAPRGFAERFLAVTPGYGRFLYMCVRASGARRIVEFGTSMGISTIYLAAGLRDNGGGHLIGSEFEPSKVVRAKAHLDAVGLADLVEIREGDALETLRDVAGPIDLLLLDGAFSLYLPVLQRLETRLRTGALVLAENALDRDYLDYVRNPTNGFLSQSVALDEGRGNEVAVVTR
ncbi:tRNA 5-hydroxyuridine methyltransferase [Alphaproteobacteria bacterium SO-S41]|nr:tRNA 5-hydroxyuridine methyltransferase [Alphaproteobacteria bacterium SO-S41]